MKTNFNKIKISLTLSVLILLSYFAAFSSAATTLSNPSFCCEKTTSGASCINAPEAECAAGFKKSPTSCETTSYCQLGTCYDSNEGICMENTPQNVCENNGGTWDPRKVDQVPQCQLGCCVIADQAAFVSLVRCKKLSTFFGVENNYNTAITNELSCIATAQAQDMGACVYEQDFERICEFTTRENCGADETKVATVNDTTDTSRKFYKDMLCSAEELNTACARQTSTTCYKGDVYWQDSCGNRENVYSNDKDKSWNNGRILEPEEVCGPSNGLGNNVNCGNCDYFLGTRCEAWNGNLGIGKPAGSDHVCQRTECVDRTGKKRLNGESWCVYDDRNKVGNGLDQVGSRHYREVCIDGEVRVEPCEDFRNEVCYEGSIETSAGEFGTSGCRVNRWQDCALQTEEEDCTNVDRRDCIWLPAVTGMILGTEGGVQQDNAGGFSNPSNTNTFSNPTATGNVVAPITGNAVSGEGRDAETTTNRGKGICVPEFAPGFNFWEGKNNQQVCGLASAECVVVYEKGLIGGSKIVQGEECLEESWALSANRVCNALGDCGAYTNFVDVFTDDGYNWVEDGKEKEFSPNAENRIKAGTINARVIQELTQ